MVICCLVCCLVESIQQYPMAIMVSAARMVNVVGAMLVPSKILKESENAGERIKRTHKSGHSEARRAGMKIGLQEPELYQNLL